jgi:hemolysin III
LRGNELIGASMRIPLINRHLPDYTRGEEIFHMVSHISGAAFAIVALVLCVVRAAISGSTWGIVCASVYGATLVVLYTMSSVYHGLYPSLGKKVLQVLDHCSIYFLIAGSYTPILLCAMRPLYPVLAWIIFGAIWSLTALAVTLTAIDLRQFRVFSMICYIAMGWGIMVVFPYAMRALGVAGFWLLLAGGVSYTFGAVLYGIGGKRRWFHGLFHLFVLLGSILHFVLIYLFVL